MMVESFFVEFIKNPFDTDDLLKELLVATVFYEYYFSYFFFDG